LTISDYVRNEIIDDIGLPPRCVTAVHLAPASVFFPRKITEVKEVLANHGWPDEYILFVGTLEPRKNLSLLIKALTMTKTKIPLILTGWQGWGDKKWMQLISERELQHRIFFTGHVDEETLACLYSGASAFVFPSLYEGFGLPILEAMACGCPVICSNAASMPEVAGEAALLINPTDEGALAYALDCVLTDSQLQQSMIQQGIKRTQQFSWRETAVKTMDIFHQVVGDKHGITW